MTDHADNHTLTPALEDYLETIFRLVNETGYARVRDIAHARQVRPGSVSPAMKRLDKLGLIEYERREYVNLTEQGAAAARRVYARHRVLRRFFGNFLALPPDIAEADACAAEHALSAEALDRLVRLFEYQDVCPEADSSLTRFHQCSLVCEGGTPCPDDCRAVRIEGVTGERVTIADLIPAQRARVRQIETKGAVRRRLLDKGVLPGTEFELARVAPAGGRMWINIQGDELALRRAEAQAVLVEVL